jgi:FAD/FMN-containing dehydrogenase
MTSAPASGTTTATTSAAASGPVDWKALRGKLSGGLLLPGDKTFDQAKLVYNPFFDGRTPAAIARCATPSDVQACLGAAAGHLPIAARSGGHSYCGNSDPDGGFVLDLGPMARIDVQGDQVVIGAGAKLGDVYAALAAAGRCLPAGSCPTVGISGLTLGGGIGVLTRKYGLTCDHLVSAQVVTADGKLRTVSASSEPDLFWALRGGGGGNFGIVTSFTFSTVPSPTLTAFSLHFPGHAAADVLDAWQHWVASAPPELWSDLALSGGSAAHFTVGGCFVGDATALGHLIDAFIADSGTPTSRWSSEMSYGHAMHYFAGSGNRESFVASSRIVGEPLADPGAVADLAAAHPGLAVTFDALGGTVAEIAPADTAFWHRRALATIQVYGGATPQSRSAVTKSVAHVVAGLADLGAGGGYVNYLDSAMPDWMDAYYGGNAGRLRQVAGRYDPNGVFRFAQGVTASA